MIAAPPFAQLATAAARGPVIIINVSSYRCDALIIADGNVQLVPLLQVSADAVTEQTEALLEAADNATLEMTLVLEWVWDSIVAPVFSRLRPPGQRR